MQGGKMLRVDRQHYGLFSVKTVTGFRCSPTSLVQMQSQNTDLCVLGGGVTSSPARSLVLDNQMTHDGELIFAAREGWDIQPWTMLWLHSIAPAACLEPQ